MTKQLSFAAYEDIIAEVTRREKEAGIMPDPDIDTYMKVRIPMSIIFSIPGHI